MSKLDKDKRTLLKKAYLAKDKQKVLDSLPIAVQTINQLFNWLDLQFETNYCDETLKQTEIFIKENNLPKTILVDWLKENGGYCDCEILANVSQHFEV